MENYGFVYIWYDKKHKRFYVGCRWGTETDGYICSSPWMKRGYKLRPNDFKRRILSRVYTNRKDLLEEEYKWLSMIKIEELGKKYYNLHNHHFNHWSSDENNRTIITEKITNAIIGRNLTEEHKRKISMHMLGNKHTLGCQLTEKHKKKVSVSLKIAHKNGKQFFHGKTHTEKWKQKHSEVMTGLNNPFYGKQHSKETKNDISKKKSVKIMTPYGIFESMKEAAIALGLSKSKVQRLIKDDKYNDWRRL